MNKFKPAVITMTRKQLEQIRREQFELAIAELHKKEQSVINTLSEESLHMVLLTGTKALMDMGCDYDFVEEFVQRLADIIVSINEDQITVDDLEQEVSDFGLQLVKEQSADVPKELLKG